MKTAFKHFGLDVYDIGRRTYAVGTDEQFDAAAKEYIRVSLWAFRPEFLAGYVPDGIDAELIEFLCEKRFEDANGPITRLVGDNLERLIDDAIAADGRGHFLCGYDDNEISSDDVDGLPRGLLAIRTN